MATLSSAPSSVNAAGAWANGSNSYSSNNTYATLSTSSSSSLDLRGFDFSSIPSGSYIVTVSVDVEHYEGQTTQNSLTCDVMDGTTLIDSHAVTTQTTESVTTYTPSTLPTLAQLQSSSFQFRVTGAKTGGGGSRTFNLDAVLITVTYGPPVDGTLASTLGDATSSMSGQVIGPPLEDHFYFNDTNRTIPLSSTFEKESSRSIVPGNTTAIHTDTNTSTGGTHAYRSDQAHTSATWPTTGWAAGINLVLGASTTVTVTLSRSNAAGTGNADTINLQTGINASGVYEWTGVSWSNVNTVGTASDDTVTIRVQRTSGTGNVSVYYDDTRSYVYNASLTDPSDSPTGTLASTLDAATASMSGHTDAVGTLASTVADATFAGAGEETFTGTLANTLGDATMAGSGEQTFTGTLASTPDDATLAASGSTGGTEGTLAVTLEDATAAITGEETFEGSLASTLADASMSSSGAAGASGTLASTLADATQEATGTETFTGTLASTLADATFAGSGTEDFTGTLASTLADSTLAASGEETITGTLASTLDASTMSASGEVSNVGAEGTLASTLADATMAATGEETITGTLASTLDAATMALSGTETIEGPLASTLAAATAAFSGLETIEGTLSPALADATLAGSGTETFTGTLAVTLDGAVMAADGLVAVDVTGELASTLDDVVVEIAGGLLNPIYYFEPPTFEGPMRTEVRPLHLFRETWAESIVRVNGSFTSIRAPSAEVCDAAGENGVDFFRGGYVYEITQATANELTAAGYTVRVVYA